MKKHLPLVLLGFVLAAGSAGADPLVPYQGPSAWSSWDASVLAPGNYTGPFWNTSSNDAGECNIGYWVTGTLGCTVTTINGYDYQFYSQSPNLITPTPDYYGGATSTFGFEATGQTVEVTLGVQMAKWARPLSTQSSANGAIAGNNIFGWYQSDAYGNPLGPGGVLFAPGSTLGQVATFNPTGYYGFYIQSPVGLFHTGMVDGVTGAAHFAVFGVDPLTGHYIVGAEDNVIGTGGDFDFNDVIVTVRTASVPEPGTLLLFGTGLLGFGCALRRRRN